MKKVLTNSPKYSKIKVVKIILTCIFLILLLKVVFIIKKFLSILAVSAILGGILAGSSPANAAGECAICLEEMPEPAQNEAAPCGHLFHASCLQQWRNHGGNSCPTCRCHLQHGRREYSDYSEYSDDEDAPPVISPQEQARIARYAAEEQARRNRQEQMVRRTETIRDITDRMDRIGTRLNDNYVVFSRTCDQICSSASPEDMARYGHGHWMPSSSNRRDPHSVDDCVDSLRLTASEHPLGPWFATAWASHLHEFTQHYQESLVFAAECMQFANNILELNQQPHNRAAVPVPGRISLNSSSRKVHSGVTFGHLQEFRALYGNLCERDGNFWLEAFSRLAQDDADPQVTATVAREAQEQEIVFLLLAIDQLSAAKALLETTNYYGW